MEMLNFTVGPVQANEEIRAMGQEQVPYFRTTEFSNLMLENEQLVKKFAHASEDAKAVFLTASGTGAMEAAVFNTLTKEDKALIVNGGSFGQRFVDLCALYEIPYTEIKLAFGESLKKEHLAKYANQNYTAFLVNVHETSTGVRYDMDLIHDFCQANNLFLIADNISSFLADEFDMAKLGVDIMIASSQKALACPPGISLLILSPKALDRINNHNVQCLYLNLKLALDNATRGQTPFTPAVGILRQINKRLNQIDVAGGEATEIAKVRDLALYFRENIKDLPLENISESYSNAVTALKPQRENAYEIFTKLKDEYHIWICPNGGEMKDKVFRVGHIGALTTADYDRLIAALKDLKEKGIL